MTYTHLTTEELTTIYNFWKIGTKAYKITNAVGRSLETIYKVYRWFNDGKTIPAYIIEYGKNKRNCGRKPIQLPKEEIVYINKKIDEGWTPDTIVGRNERTISCSMRTLYRKFKRGEFNFSKEKLPMKGKRHLNGFVETRGKRGQLGIDIKQRYKDYPNYKHEFGHFEGDTIQGKNHKGAITSLVERISKFEILLNSHNKSADCVNKVISSVLSKMPPHFFKSITFDNGKEFSEWRDIANKYDVNIYFAEVGTPNQRGLNENNNGLARRDGLGKDLDFTNLPDEFVKAVALRRNNIPRKSLGYKTPCEVLLEHVTSDDLYFFLT